MTLVPTAEWRNGFSKLRKTQGLQKKSKIGHKNTRSCGKTQGMVPLLASQRRL